MTPFYYQPVEADIQKYLMQHGTEIRYHSESCTKNDWFGYFDHKSKKIYICPDVISKFQGSQVSDPNAKFNEVLRHETVHYIQYSCNGGKIINSNYTNQWLRPRKRRIIEQTEPAARNIEKEAHYLEEYPLLVYSILKSKCPLTTARK